MKKVIILGISLISLLASAQDAPSPVSSLGQVGGSLASFLKDKGQACLPTPDSAYSFGVYALTGALTLGGLYYSYRALFQSPLEQMIAWENKQMELFRSEFFATNKSQQACLYVAQKIFLIPPKRFRIKFLYECPHDYVDKEIGVSHLYKKKWDKEEIIRDRIGLFDLHTVKKEESSSSAVVPKS